MKILFDTNIYNKDFKSLKSKNGNIVGRVLSKEIEYDDDNESEVGILAEREAYRVKECFEAINKDIRIEIDVRYYDTISSTWTCLYTVRNFK